MYISYANLWKLLIDKDITKTELMELSKISSRTLAKLSKNQTVTTQTLLAICETLNCNISDIMEIKEGEESLSFYEAFKRNAILTHKDKLCMIYSLNYKGNDYTIKKTNRVASKHTIIHCEGENIIWEQLYPIGASPAKERTVITKKSFAKNEARGVFVINGTPLSIKGLDENGYVSAKQSIIKKEDINVITRAELKVFEPQEKKNEKRG